MLALSRVHPSSSKPPLILALIGIAAAGVLIWSLTLAQPSGPLPEKLDFAPFRLIGEEYTGGVHVATFELEWRGRNDWLERLLWTSGGRAPGMASEVRNGMYTHFNGVSSTSSPIEKDSVHVPGVWFRDLVATLPGPQEATSQTTSMVTVTRTTTSDVEEWDADLTTGIPLGYRQSVGGTVVREHRVVSLVLADGTIIR